MTKKLEKEEQQRNSFVSLLLAMAALFLFWYFPVTLEPCPCPWFIYV